MFSSTSRTSQLSRQIGGDDQDALRRHEGAHAVGQLVGVLERAEGRGIARKDAQDAPDMAHAEPGFSSPSTIPVMIASRDPLSRDLHSASCTAILPREFRVFQKEHRNEPIVRADAAGRHRRPRHREGDAALGRGMRRRPLVLRRAAAADRIPLQGTGLRHQHVGRAGQFRRRAARTDPAALRQPEPLPRFPRMPGTRACSTGRAGRSTTTRSGNGRCEAAGRSARRATRRAARSSISSTKATPARSSRWPRRRPTRMRIFDQVREAALNWDGSDPIRLNWPQG